MDASGNDSFDFVALLICISFQMENLSLVPRWNPNWAARCEWDESD